MKTTALVTVLLLIVSVLFTACGGSTAAANGKSFDIVLKANSDDGDPVEGVQFATGGRTIGNSNTRGILATALRGSDGQSFLVSATCPDGYAGPDQPTTLKLTEVRRVNEAGPAPLGIEVICTRKMREIVIVVRTANAPSLPVDVGGKTVGTTDSNGNAHLRLQLDREVRTLSVTLGTADAPTLRPQNPSRVYELEGQDALLLLDQSFTTERKASPKRWVATTTTPPKHVPYRIDSGRYHGF